MEKHRTERFHSMERCDPANGYHPVSDLDIHLRLCAPQAISFVSIRGRRYCYAVRVDIVPERSEWDAVHLQEEIASLNSAYSSVLAAIYRSFHRCRGS